MLVHNPKSIPGHEWWPQFIVTYDTLVANPGIQTQLDDWCLDNCQGQWGSDFWSLDMPLVYYIDQYSDASRFRLTWDEYGTFVHPEKYLRKSDHPADKMTVHLIDSIAVLNSVVAAMKAHNTDLDADAA